MKEQGFAANMFVGVATNSIRCQLIKPTCVLGHMHVTWPAKVPKFP